MFTIYLASNAVNGRRYVGFTSRTLEERQAEHKKEAQRRSPKTHFHSAVHKHGIDNFKLEVLEEGWDPRIGLEIREPFWISVLKPEYNATHGGDGFFGRTNTVEQSQAQSVRQKGIKRTTAFNAAIAARMKGKQITLGQKRSVEQKLTNSLSQKNIPKVTCPNCGKTGGSGGMRRYHFNYCKHNS